MTGWGQDGPLAARAGHDINYLAATGLLHAIGPTRRARRSRSTSLGDNGGGALYLVVGVLAALLEARQSGRGQVVDAAIVDGAAAPRDADLRAAGRPACGAISERRNLLDGGTPFYDVYETSDGRHVAVGPLEPQFYAEFVRLLGLDDLPDRTDMSAVARAARSADRRPFRAATRMAEWAAVFAGSDACVMPVSTLREAADHPQLAARRSLRRAPRQPSAGPGTALLPHPRRASARRIGESGLARGVAGIVGRSTMPAQLHRRGRRQRDGGGWHVKRTLFEADHEAFRETCRSFCDKEIAPHHAEWERAGIVPRELWLKAGELGLLGFMMPEVYGGSAVDDFRFNVILNEELVRVGASGVGFPLHNDIVAAYLRDLGHRRAEGALAARLLRRLHDLGDRDDRARCRLRPSGHPHRRTTRRRRVRAERPEDVHHQRHQRRPRHRGREDRPRQPATRASRCSSSSAGWPASSAAATSTRSGSRPKTPPSCSSTTCGFRPRTCSATRGRVSSYLMQNLPQERLCIAVSAGQPPASGSSP